MRPAAARGLAIGLGIVIASVAAEGIARVVRGPDLVAIVEAGFESAGDSTAMAVRVDDGRVYGARPSHVGPTVTINSQGVRGPERPINRPDGVRRVVLLGDSVAFGAEVDQGKTIAPRTEALLGGGWEVWNLGFPGYNTRQEAAALDGLGARLTPDVIVVLWVTNDAASLEIPLGGSADGPALYVQRRVHLLPGLSEASQVALWQRSALFRSLGDALGGPDEVVLEEREHRAAIAAIAARAEVLGAPLIFAMMPPLIDYPGWQEAGYAGRPAPPWSTDPVWRAARSEAQAAGATVLDLTLALAGHRPTDLQVDEIHPNEAGHRLIAEFLAPRIVDAVGD